MRPPARVSSIIEELIGRRFCLESQNNWPELLFLGLLTGLYGIHSRLDARIPGVSKIAKAASEPLQDRFLVCNSRMKRIFETRHQRDVCHSDG
jgi:hypothetical protein